MIAATETTILFESQVVSHVFLSLGAACGERQTYQLHALKAETTGFMMAVTGQAG